MLKSFITLALEVVRGRHCERDAEDAAGAVSDGGASSPDLCAGRGGGHLRAVDDGQTTGRAGGRRGWHIASDARHAVVLRPSGSIIARSTAPIAVRTATAG